MSRKLADEVGGYVGTFFNVVVTGPHSNATEHQWATANGMNARDEIEIAGMD